MYKLFLSYFFSKLNLATTMLKVKAALNGNTLLTTHPPLCADQLCIGSHHVVQAISFFMQFKTLRRRENGSKLSLGRIANSISRRAHIAFCSFQYPSAPAAMLALCYQTGLFTHILHSSGAFQSKIQSLVISEFEMERKHKLKKLIQIHVGFI